MSLCADFRAKRRSGCAILFLNFQARISYPGEPNFVLYHVGTGLNGPTKESTIYLDGRSDLDFWRGLRGIGNHILLNKICLQSICKEEWRNDEAQKTFGPGSWFLIRFDS